MSRPVIFPSFIVHFPFTISHAQRLANNYPPRRRSPDVSRRSKASVNERIVVRYRCHRFGRRTSAAGSKGNYPDVAILDMNMPKMTGLGVLRELKKLGSRTEVIFLTMFDDEDILNEAIDLGVKGYILKESASVDIVKAVHAALEGRYYISSALTNKLLNRKEKQKSFTSSHPQLQSLTPQELRILKMIGDSKTSKEIAEELFLSQKTVDNYRFKISEKLHLSGSYSLLKFALENKSLL